MKILLHCTLIMAYCSPYSRNQHTDAKYHRDMAKLKIRHIYEEEFIQHVRRNMELCYQTDYEYDCLSTLFNHDYFWL